MTPMNSGFADAMRRSLPRRSEKKRGPRLVQVGAKSQLPADGETRRSASRGFRARKALTLLVPLFFLNFYNSQTSDRLPVPRARARPRDRRLGLARERLPGAPPPFPPRR